MLIKVLLPVALRVVRPGCPARLDPVTAHSMITEGFGGRRTRKSPRSWNGAAPLATAPMGQRTDLRRPLVPDARCPGRALRAARKTWRRFQVGGSLKMS